ncbi:cytochrome P450 4C1-like isoform X1 [Cataglyphis hispanica]|uniref:cytochrome P450 4C1-like isoform X1 n=1 Tax=Cataglyphis hispanica TaxID=1086592 RepID=UPI0021805801|nr:cytochrome P450 4C1-like isoform X1 [Cataglyphis hispanica]
MSLLLLIVSAISVIIFYKIVLIVYSHYTMRKKLSHIPGTMDYSFLETLYDVVKPLDEHMKCFLSLLQKNKNGLYTIWIGQQPVVFIFKPEFLESIFQANTHVEKGELYDSIKLFLGNGLLTAPVKQWYRDRRILLPVFHFNILEQFAVIMSEKTEIIIKCIEEKLAENSTKIVDILLFMQKLAFNIICETMMGVNVDDEEITSYRLTMNRFLKLQKLHMHLQWLRMHDWMYYLIPYGKEYKAVINNMNSITNKIIQKKKVARIKNNKSQNEEDDTQGDDSNTQDKQKRKAFINLLLDMNEKDGVSLTDEDLRAHVSTFILAGHDTTAVSISWALFCIGNDPQCQEKIHEELKEIFKDSQRPASIKELSQLKYLERVIKESRRLYPSIPNIVRKTSEDVKMGNYVIPKNTLVSVPIMLIHRNPAVWPDPLKFDPDRFLPENLKQVHSYAYIPFSAGSRNCIGQKFAAMEEKIVLAAILRKWRVKSMKKHEEMTMHNFAVLRPSEESIYLQLLPWK